MVNSSFVTEKEDQDDLQEKRRQEFAILLSKPETFSERRRRGIRTTSVMGLNTQQVTINLMWKWVVRGQM